jgi:hypothetical protein
MPWIVFKTSCKKDYHVVHCWRAVKNAPKWRFDYEAYNISMKNGGADVAVALDGKNEALVKGPLPSRPRGHKASKVDLKYDASTCIERDIKDDDGRERGGHYQEEGEAASTARGHMCHFRRPHQIIFASPIF